MITWYWLIVCASVFTMFGYFLCALMVIAKDADKHIDKTFLKMISALRILKTNNPLHNDLDAYLFDVVDWGLGKEKRPNPEDFGLQKEGKDEENQNNA